MSFILDALKKLEREKAARSCAGVNISEEILRGKPRGRSSRTHSLAAIGAVAALALLAVGAVVAGVLYWQGDRAQRETREIPSVEENRHAASAVPGQPRPADTVSVPAGGEIAPAVPTPRPVQVGGQAALERRPALNPVTTAAGADPGQGASGANEIDAPPAGVDVKVSGIAWQEKRSARRAVINGLLVNEGTPVGGVTVKEIFQNRVRLQGNGRTFDVYISGPLLGDTPRSEPSGQSVRNYSPPQGDLSMATSPRRLMRSAGQPPDISGER